VISSAYPGPSQILKYDAAGNFITKNAIDSIEGDGGYYGAIGLVYSETCDCLYTSNGTTTDDCVSTFDTNLVYLGASVGPVGDASGTNAYPSFNKALGIITECCPKPDSSPRTCPANSPAPVAGKSSATTPVCSTTATTPLPSLAVAKPASNTPIPI